MNTSNNRKYGILLNYLSMFLNSIIGILFLPILTRELGQSEYGLYSIALALVSMLSILDLGFNQSIVRYISKYEALRDKDAEENLVGFFLRLYLVIALLCAVICTIVVFTLPLVYRYSMNEGELQKLTVIIAVFSANVCISFPLSVFSAILNAKEKFILLKITNIISVIAKYSSMYVVLMLGYNVIAISVVIAATSIGYQLYLFVYCLRSYNISLKKANVKASEKREIYGFSFFVFMNSVIGVMFDSTDKLLIGGLIGSAEVAVYNVGMQFTSYFSDLSIAISGVFLPHMTKLYVENDNENMKKTFNKIGRIQYILLSFIMFSFLALGQEFISLWLKNGYEQSFFVAVIIMIPAILNLTQNIGVSILRAMNLHKYRTYIMFVTAVINIISSIPLLLKFQSVGAAIGTGISNVMCCICSDVLYVKKVGLDIKGYWKDVLKISLYEAGYYLILRILNTALNMHNWETFLIKVVIGMFIQGLLLWRFVLNEYEKSLMLVVIGRIRKK